MTQREDLLARAAECARLAREAPNRTARLDWERMEACLLVMAEDCREPRKGPRLCGVRIKP